VAKEARFEVTSLGETMLRLSVPVGGRLETMRRLDVHVGGAESNVCAALAALGRRTGWVSRLPDHALGQHVLRQLKAAGIDTSAVVLAEGARMGSYYVEFAASPRPIQVIYDRARSAAAEMKSNDIDWDYLLDTRVLHLTGITPALGTGCRQLALEAVERARGAGVAVSFDVNYRSRLLSAQEAAAMLLPLVKDVDILICAREDSRKLFSLVGTEEEVLARLRDLTEAKRVILTLGGSGAAAFDGENYLFQPAVAAGIVDRIGAGDALAAGVLDGYLDGSLEEGLRRGATLAALALSQHGDLLVTSRSELEATMVFKDEDISR
jgi:2-dehydro-3-deoxygluconokinase